MAALLTLEPTAVDLHKVVECLDNIKKTKKRADYQFLCPHVSLDSKSGDLIILMPEKIATNQNLLNKLEKIGLIKEEVDETRRCGDEKRKFTLQFVIPQLEIEAFLRDELFLNGKVYYEVMDMKKRRS